MTISWGEWAAGIDLQLPNQRFFTPTQVFWDVISKLVPKEVTLVDLGCGTGELSSEAQKRGFNSIGVDLFLRDDQPNSSVIRADAVTWGLRNLSETTWGLVCRPAPSALVPALQRVAVQTGSTLFYVGLRRNFTKHLGDNWQQYPLVAEEVGRSGECLVQLTGGAKPPRF